MAGTLALGAGSFTVHGVPPKAALLDRAAAAGIAVPGGIVIPDGVDAPTAPSLDVVDDATASTLAVRSAFGAEDGRDDSLAGWFTSLLGVEWSALAEAVDTVRASADRRDGEFRRDVLVMEMVNARQAGVAFSEPGTYDDLVNVTDGLADALVSGEVAGERRHLPRLESTDAGWPTRLQGLLDQVRDEFGDEPWDIEWADDGDVCWLVQIRPISAAPLRDETLTAANHAEILPALPSHLMTSIIAEAGPDLFDWYRARVPGLPAEREFLHVVHGRPMINLSLLEDMLRHLGLPTRLVAESIGGGHGSDHPADIGRLARRAPSLIRLGWAQISAVVFARRNRQRAASIGEGPATTFTAAVDDLHASYVALVTGMFPLSSAIGPPLAILRASGTLYEHAARHRTVTVEMAAGQQSVDEAGPTERPAAVAAFLADFGHRGIYESDIARPRYRDDPTTIGETSDAPAAARTDHRAAAAPPRRTWRGRLTSPVWAVAARPLAARELLRHDAMRSFGNIRRALVTLAARAVDDGRLRSLDDLWLLTAAEVRRLDTTWQPDADFWARRESERTALATIDVPHVVSRLDDPANWLDDESADSMLTGLALTVGSVTGRAWVLDEPASSLPDGFERDTTVLVARSIDAGWISTIGRVAAVVVEIGGDLSHGSILVRELGLPAVTNVTGATRRLATGDEITVDAGAGIVRGAGASAPF